MGAPTRRVSKSAAIAARIAAKREGSLSAKNSRIVSAVPQRAARDLTGRLVVAFDPGGSTGVAVRYPDGRLMTHTATGPSDVYEFVMAKPDVVVCELFATGGRVDKYMIYTIDLVGGIKALCFAYGVRCVMHTPQKRYPWLEAASAQLAKSYSLRHEADALAHLFAFEELGE